MKLDPRFVLSQVMRMEHLDFFPRDEKGIDELIQAFRNAVSEVVVTAVVQEWIETQAKRPTPADLYRAVMKHNTLILGGKSAATTACSRCCNTGTVIVAMTFRCCSCRFGQAAAAYGWDGLSAEVGVSTVREDGGGSFIPGSRTPASDLTFASRDVLPNLRGSNAPAATDLKRTREFTAFHQAQGAPRR